MYAVILQRADHLQASAITHMREPRIFVAAEMSLQNSTIFGAIENSAPRLKLAHAIGRFLGVQLGHAPLVHVLATAHCIGEMHFPVVSLIDIGQCRGDSTFSHYRMRFAQQRFANERDANASSRGLNSCAQPRATSADNQYIVIKSFVL